MERAICANRAAASFSGKGPTSQMRSKSSPPERLRACRERGGREWHEEERARVAGEGGGERGW
jgi:hypothetical protein